MATTIASPPPGTPGHVTWTRLDEEMTRAWPGWPAWIARREARRKAGTS